jgi:hypothetical protein
MLVNQNGRPLFPTRDDPSSWPGFRPLIIAHDVARSRDRSTAVIGGNGPFPPRLTGISQLVEFQQGLYGAARANALAQVDRQYGCNALIVVDVSHDPTYAEVLYEMFGPRVIGLHISRHGDGMQADHRPVKGGHMPVYTVGRSYLLELLHSDFQADLVKMVDGPMSRRAYDQLANLEVEQRESGVVYSCPSGQHDDLAISIAMLNWFARHPHLDWYVTTMLRHQRPRRPRQPINGAGWT